MKTLKIKRVYETPSKEDGVRILVDRLWPRGVSKEKADIAYWDKDIAPSSELRKWFNHEPEKFKEFSHLYKKELAAEPAKISGVLNYLKENDVTLIYAAKDPAINHVVVLKDFIEHLRT